MAKLTVITRSRAWCGEFRRRNGRVLLLAVGLLFALGQGPDARAAEAPYPDEWSFVVTPYVWLPTINATFDFPYSGSGTGGSTGLPGTIHSEIGPNQYLTKLNFALMLNGTARRGPWSVTGDFIGVWVSGLDGAVRSFTPAGGGHVQIPVGAGIDHGTQTKLNTTVWTLTAGYELIDTGQFRLDSIAGIRYADLSATMDWHLSADLMLPDHTVALNRSGSLHASRSPLDALVGARGRYTINDRWSIPYQADIGGGDTKLDWEVLAGVSYSFSWGDVSLLYRHLSIEQQSDRVFTKLALGGPVLGASFHF